MANTSTIDLKFYWAVFLRRLPYFLVVAALLTAVGVTVAMVLPAVYRSQASMLVEPQQIPDQLAETTVPINPYEQAQIIEQRLMTRANLLELADRLGLYEDLPEPMSANAIVGDMRDRIEFIGFIPDVTQMRGIPGATILGVAFEAETADMALKGTNSSSTWCCRRTCGSGPAGPGTRWSSSPPRWSGSPKRWRPRPPASPSSRPPM